ncbi:hypothetical protein JKP88DRAFT_255067 [Tribonema minus]|uniref:Uncharacterized protein n=1 Tax=Tribonema minus TaxID=303371 RepID=A0A835Z858_9STRA|nr:hypothetical protein JKP88DRAFT_255067 [Tribonema minus]
MMRTRSAVAVAAYGFKLIIYGDAHQHPTRCSDLQLLHSNHALLLTPPCRMLPPSLCFRAAVAAAAQPRPCRTMAEAALTVTLARLLSRDTDAQDGGDECYGIEDRRRCQVEAAQLLQAAAALYAARVARRRGRNSNAQPEVVSPVVWRPGIDPPDDSCGDNGNGYAVASPADATNDAQARAAGQQPAVIAFTCKPSQSASDCTQAIALYLEAAGLYESLGAPAAAATAVARALHAAEALSGTDSLSAAKLCRRLGAAYEAAGDRAAAAAAYARAHRAYAVRLGSGDAGVQRLRAAAEECARAAAALPSGAGDVAAGVGPAIESAKNLMVKWQLRCIRDHAARRRERRPPHTEPRQQQRLRSVRSRASAQRRGLRRAVAREQRGSAPRLRRRRCARAAAAARVQRRRVVAGQQRAGCGRAVAAVTRPRINRNLCSSSSGRCRLAQQTYGTGDMAFSGTAHAPRPLRNARSSLTNKTKQHYDRDSDALFLKATGQVAG